MKYVIAHGALAVLTFVMASCVSMLIVLNVDETTPYIGAMAGLIALVVSWFPFAATLNETVGEYQALKRRRRKAAMRRHPSRIKRR